MGFKKLANPDINRPEDDPRLMGSDKIESLQECRTPFIDPNDVRVLLQEINMSISQLAIAISTQTPSNEESIALLRSIQHYVSYSAPPEGLVYSTGQVAIIVATPIKPDADVIGAVGIPGYEQHQIFDVTNRIAKKVSVINDGSDSLYVINSQDGQVFSEQESLILTGESREFYDVYELRVRCPTIGNLYRVTEYQYSLAYAAFITPNQTAIGIQSVLNLPVLGVGTQQLPSLTPPAGFSLCVRADPNNAGDIYIASSAARLGAAATRAPLAPGDILEFNISNADLLWSAGAAAGYDINLFVEQ